MWREVVSELVSIAFSKSNLASEQLVLGKLTGSQRHLN